jgi:hypothetical protein
MRLTENEITAIRTAVAAHWERRLSSRLVAVAARCRVGEVWMSQGQSPF